MPSTAIYTLILRTLIIIGWEECYGNCPTVRKPGDNQNTKTSHDHILTRKCKRRSYCYEYHCSYCFISIVHSLPLFHRIHCTAFWVATSNLRKKTYQRNRLDSLLIVGSISSLVHNHTNYLSFLFRPLRMETDRLMIT